MSVWLTIPSKRSPEESVPVLMAWKERGYKIALWRDDQNFPDGIVNIIRSEREYPGYAVAVNRLIEQVIANNDDAEWFICGGDDVLPDPDHSAEEIAIQCREHFFAESSPQTDARFAMTFGVMQPTGDRWGIDPNAHVFVSQTPGCDACVCQVCGRGNLGQAVHLTGAYIDRVAGSPWIGREFARRMYQGNGPYWPAFEHMYVDEHLMCVAQKLGVFWQRSDLIHYHQHWGRPRPGENMAPSDRMPEFLKKANSPEHWRKSKAIFDQLKAGGFSEALDLLP